MTTGLKNLISASAVVIVLGIMISVSYKSGVKKGVEKGRAEGISDTRHVMTMEKTDTTVKSCQEK